jgi:NAD(P)-dependent dehydrogenase (short-subunit alcohol dehydrogenase family)
MMKDLESDGIRVLQLDLTDEDSVEACVKSIIEREGRIDILVNMRGTARMVPSRISRSARPGASSR